MRGMNRLRLPADRKGAAVLLGAVLLALGALWAASQPSTTGGGLAGLGLLALAGIRAGAGAQAFATANRLTGAATGKAWRFLTTAWVLAALSALLLWGGWALRGQVLEVPSLADLLLLAGSSCALWAVASYGAGPTALVDRPPSNAASAPSRAAIINRTSTRPMGEASPVIAARPAAR